MEQRNTVNIPPHAANLVTSLQGMTYDFPKAVADIVDNSIAAHASAIWIEISDGVADGFGEPYVAIVDNGYGMDKKGLIRALGYGVASEEQDRDLGRFGLGMKTASLSQCHVLTVASKSEKDGSMNILQWNLPYLRNEAGENWDALIPDIKEIPEHLCQKISETCGTIVLWKNLEKMNPNIPDLNQYNLGQFLGRKVRECEDHIAAVFHRFITGETRVFDNRKILFSMNGRAIEPWDPFLSNHPKQMNWRFGFDGLPPSSMRPMEGDDDSHINLVFRGAEMRMQASILPRQKDFEDIHIDEDTIWTAHQQHKAAGGVGGWNANQGVYLYRLDRLIQQGGWCYLMANDEHNKLARVSIDVDRKWDHLLSLNVTKTKVLIPNELKEDLRMILSGIRSFARKVYDNEMIWTDDGWTVEAGADATTDAGTDTGADADTGAGDDNGSRTRHRPRPRQVYRNRRLDDSTLQKLTEACNSEEERNLLANLISRATLGS